MIKRAFDMLIVTLLLIILLPVFAIIALKVKSKLGTPILFRQIRPGFLEEPFEMIKFRTMLDAEICYQIQNA